MPHPFYQETVANFVYSSFELKAGCTIFYLAVINRLFFVVDIFFSFFSYFLCFVLFFSSTGFLLLFL